MTQYSDTAWTVVLIGVIAHMFQLVLNLISMGLMVRLFGFKRIVSESLVEAMFILNFSDFIYSFPGLLQSIPALYYNDMNYIIDRCSFNGILTVFCAVMSVAAVVILALNRYVVIVLGKSMNRPFFLILKVTLAPAIVAAITVVISTASEHAYTIKGSGNICWPAWYHPDMKYVSVAMAIVLAISLLFIVFTYVAVIVKIYRTVSEARQFFSTEVLTTGGSKDTDNFNEEAQAAKRILIIMIAALLSWTLLLASIFAGINGQQLPIWFEDIEHLLNAFMGCMDPILTILFNHVMRNHVVQVFRSIA